MKNDGITDAMIDAGMRVLLEHCPDSATGDAVDRLMLREIYKAMASLEAGREVPLSGRGQPQHD